MAYARISTKELVKQMSDTNSVVNGWDVLCSYDLQILNKVLLLEYKKRPVNTRLKFTTAKKIMGFRYEANCDIQLGSPVLRFSTAQSGIYDLLIPIEAGSHCNQTFNGLTSKTSIPPGYNILTSGPLKSVKGNKNNQTVYSSNEIVEFGNQTEATIILHFGKNLRTVSIVPKKIHEDFKALLGDIRDNFSDNIEEVNYNIVTIRKDPPKKGLILTPRSFIFTTMADERNRENGALNVWVQTNESGRTKGNPQPSFYPNSAVLPVPLSHSSSLVFSHQLIYHRYLKPALENFYNVGFTQLFEKEKTHMDSITLVPLNKSKQSFYESFPGRENNLYTFTIDLNAFPFHLYTHNDKLHLTWKYKTILEYEESKLIESLSTGLTIGAVVGAIIGTVLAGPVGGAAGGSLGLGLGGTGGAITGNVDRVRKQFTLTLSVDKSIPFVSTDNTKFSAEIKLRPQDLHVDAQLKSKSGFRIADVGLSVEEMQSRIISNLKKTITIPDIDLGTLDYFAEANILFNEGRFKISADKAIHFPYDTIIIGDIHMSKTSKNRYKREENNPFIYPETIASSASRITTPINSMINWLTDSFKQISLLNPFDGINKIFALPQTTEKFASNAAHFDVNSSLLLGDLFIRSFTKEKPFYVVENQTDYAEIKGHALNILTEYENMLQEKDLLSAFQDFDPLLLMSALEKEIINGGVKGTFDILYRPILDNVAFEEMADIEKKIYDILHNQETHTYNTFQENTDFIVSNNYNLVVS